jgi:hypothetical protein
VSTVSSYGHNGGKDHRGVRVVTLQVNCQVSTFVQYRRQVMLLGIECRVAVCCQMPENTIFKTQVTHVSDHRWLGYSSTEIRVGNYEQLLSKSGIQNLNLKFQWKLWVAQIGRHAKKVRRSQLHTAYYLRHGGCS